MLELTTGTNSSSFSTVIHSSMQWPLYLVLGLTRECFIDCVNYFDLLLRRNVPGWTEYHLSVPIISSPALVLIWCKQGEISSGVVITMITTEAWPITSMIFLFARSRFDLNHLCHGKLPACHYAKARPQRIASPMPGFSKPAFIYIMFFFFLRHLLFSFYYYFYPFMVVYAKSNHRILNWIVMIWP